MSHPSVLKKLICFHALGLPDIMLPLDQHLCLEGPNSLLKSALQKAVCCFYLGDPYAERLQFNGLTFRDYFFPHSNSHLIWEISYKKKGFCVWRYLDQQGRLVFRLVNGLYDSTYFVDEKKQVLQPEQVLGLIQKHKITHTEAHYSVEDYVDLLSKQTLQKWPKSYRSFSIFPAGIPERIHRIFNQPYLSLKESLILGAKQNAFPLQKIKQLLHTIEIEQQALDDWSRQTERIDHILSSKNQIIHLQNREKALNSQQEAQKINFEEDKLEKAKALYQLEKQLELLDKGIQASAELARQKSQEIQAKLAGINRLITEAEERKKQYADQKPDEQAEQMALLGEVFFEPQGQATARMAIYQEWYEQQQLSYQTWIDQSNQDAFQDQKKKLLDQSAQIKKAIENLSQAMFNASSASRPDQDQVTHWQGIERKAIQLEWQQKQWLEKGKALEKQKQSEFSLLKENERVATLAYEQQKATLNESLKEIEEKLSAIKQTFGAWLDQHYPEWEQSMGKLLREDVLAHPYLSPSIDRINDLLFGIQLDLSELPVNVKREADYLKEKKTITDQIARASSDFQAQKISWEKKRLNATKRWKQKLRGHQREGDKLQYELEQTQIRQKQLQVRLKSDQLNNQQQWEQKQVRLQYDWLELQEKQKRTQKELEELEQSIEQSRRKAQEELEKKLSKIESRLKKRLKAIDKGEKKDSNTDYLVLRQYLSDRLGFFQYLDSWHSERKKLESALEQHLAEVLTQKNRYQEEAKKLVVQQKGLRESPSESEINYTDQIEENRLLLEHQQENLRHEILAFTGHFSVENPFLFPIQFEQEGDFMRFAELLARFVQEGQIEQVRDQVASQKADLIGAIHQESEAIPSFDFDEAIEAWNSRFAQLPNACRFEIRRKENAQGLRSCLMEIRSFFQQSGHLLGSVSLFNQQEANQVNRKALALLGKLREELQVFEGKDLLPIDHFELESRFKHPGFETGWEDGITQIPDNGDQQLIDYWLCMANIHSLGLNQCWAMPLGKMPDWDAEHQQSFLTLAAESGLTILYEGKKTAKDDSTSHFYAGWAD